jgi:poly-gamma-glutamate synthesis protein (capsule biosynthesis protein)
MSRRAFGSVVAIAFSSLAWLAACTNDAPPTEEDDEVGPDLSEQDLTVPSAREALTFSNACAPGRRLTIAAVGDVLLHSPLQRQAYASGFETLWKGVQPLLSQADLTYANFEGPAAAGTNSAGKDVRDPGLTFDGVVYTSYPMFNYHPSLIPALQTLGVDVVSTANNHSLDRRSLGADRTIEAMKEHGMAFTGTRPANDRNAPFYTITEKNGFKIGWIACSFSTNGIPDPNKQVLMCFQDTAEIERIIADLKTRTDAVFITPHWGVEYVYTPGRDQKDLAKRLIKAGALAVFGGHPHVVQPWEKIVDEATGREGFVIYSLGNFVSGQTPMPRRASLVLYLGLTKDSSGKVTINGVRYVPLTMRQWTVEPSDKAQNSSDTRALVETIYGKWNQMASTAPLNTTPDCR